MSIQPAGAMAPHALQGLGNASVSRTDRDGDTDNSTHATDATEGAKSTAAPSNPPGVGQYVNLVA